MAKANPKFYALNLNDIRSLIEKFFTQKYTVVAPTLKDQSIFYDEISFFDEIPMGYGENQEAGIYRIKRRNDEALFGYNLGPNSWKDFLFPPRKKLWSAQKTKEGSFDIIETKPESKKYAFIGARPCELKAMEIQDKVFINEHHIDSDYQNKRKNSFIVAVNCSQAAPTCFCTSLNTGPKADSGFDLALTEILEDDRHEFLLEVGSEKGKDFLQGFDFAKDDKRLQEKSEKVLEKTRSSITRKLETKNLKENLYKNLEHPHWEEIAKRCLSCANCTMVCPTCFCSTVEDVTDLSGEHAERWQRWSSCFTSDFSYTNGGEVHASIKSRYRQWLSHKLASWQDQFDTIGCVGCGRCVTWCPVEIDFTKEIPIFQNGGS